MMMREPFVGDTAQRTAGKSIPRLKKMRFSGHQTFVCRNGWLEKGVGLVKGDGRGFLAEDAIVKLGVGKNMVESIKYWCQQTGLVEEDETAGTMRLTPLGEFLFGRDREEGVDPYLEDDASLWLLHYQIVAEGPMSTWSLVFNDYNKPEFKKEDLTAFIVRKLQESGATVSEKTIERDVDCFTRTHAGSKAKGEESFDSPFLGLHLLQGGTDAGLYRLNIGKKHNLPDALIGYATLKFMHSHSELSVSLPRLLFDPKSPGQVFKLDQAALVDAVLALGEKDGGKLDYSDTAGLNIVQYRGDRDTLGRDADNYLRNCYETGDAR